MENPNENQPHTENTENDLQDECIGGQWALIIEPLMLIVREINKIRDCLKAKYNKLIKTIKQ